MQEKLIEFDTIEFKDEEGFDFVRLAEATEEKPLICKVTGAPVEGEGEFGKFWNLPIITEDGEEKYLTYSSKRFKKFIDLYLSKIQGRSVLIFGRGKSFERQYKIKTLPETQEIKKE